jgi:hypothetical protein
MVTIDRCAVFGSEKQSTTQSLAFHLSYTTSLAKFRSYTIVHIPHGQFLAVQKQLYANINLLRMALALNNPRFFLHSHSFLLHELKLHNAGQLDHHYPCIPTKTRR